MVERRGSPSGLHVGMLDYVRGPWLKDVGRVILSPLLSPNPLMASRPPTGEIFLRFCSYVRQLGVKPGRRKSAGPPATLNLLDSGELEMWWSAAAAVAAAPKGKKPRRSDCEAETETEELAMGQVNLATRSIDFQNMVRIVILRLI